MNFEYTSGGVVFKRENEKTLWLITRSSPSELYPKAFWRLPKGWLDDEGNNPGPLARGDKKASEADLKKAALREVKEEAGVDVKIIKKVVTNKVFFTKDGKKYIKFVTFYLMEWKRNLPDGFGFETSETGWFVLEKAKEKLKYKSEKETLEKANMLLKSGTQGNLV
jgi:8-oxo-dGTP pyrophosphatase MutT (NUDIX family)